MISYNIVTKETTLLMLIEISVTYHFYARFRIPADSRRNLCPCITFYKPQSKDLTGETVGDLRNVQLKTHLLCIALGSAWIVARTCRCVGQLGYGRTLRRSAQLPQPVLLLSNLIIKVIKLRKVVKVHSCSFWRKIHGCRIPPKAGVSAHFLQQSSQTGTPSG